MRVNRSTVGGYFLAGRSVTWWPVSNKRLTVVHHIKLLISNRLSHACAMRTLYDTHTANVLMQGTFYLQ